MTPRPFFFSCFSLTLTKKKTKQNSLWAVKIRRGIKPKQREMRWDEMRRFERTTLTTFWKNLWKSYDGRVMFYDGSDTMFRWLKPWTLFTRGNWNNTFWFFFFFCPFSHLLPFSLSPNPLCCSYFKRTGISNWRRVTEHQFRQILWGQWTPWSV